MVSYSIARYKISIFLVKIQNYNVQSVFDKNRYDKPDSIISDIARFGYI